MKDLKTIARRPVNQQRYDSRSLSIARAPIICPRCGRENHPWPLKRADVCSPKDWAHCIRVLS